MNIDRDIYPSNVTRTLELLIHSAHRMDRKHLVGREAAAKEWDAGVQRLLGALRCFNEAIATAPGGEINTEASPAPLTAFAKALLKPAA